MNVLRSVLASCLLFAAIGAGAQESGGVSGADFLISPPLARVDAMGGVLDPLGTTLDGMYANPSSLAGLDGTRVQLTVVPLPNDVLNAQLALGFPLLGGYAGVGAQMLNAGGFTFVNGSGQPQGTSNVFDAAGGISYAHTIGRYVSLGANVKAIYRALGDKSAFAVAGDIGAGMRFETPHVGQAPKPPTREQFKSALDKANAQIDSERDRRVKEAARAAAELQASITQTQKTIADLGAQIDKTEQAKRAPLQAKKDAAEASLGDLRAKLAAAQAKEQQAVADGEAWRTAERAKAQAAYDAKLKDLDWVVSERARLFDVIADPTKELTEASINVNIEASIAKTQSLLQESTDASSARQAAYAEKRALAIAATEKAIAGYQAQIDAALGPQQKQAAAELQALKDQRASLASQAKSDANTKAIQKLDGQISAKEKEIAALASDLWVKRLQDRIQQKKREIEQIKAEVAARAASTNKAIAEARAAATRDTKAFEDLRAGLNKELTKAKLKRDLARLEGGSKAALDKAASQYKATEKALYLRLLAAMYNHEEKIFQSRLALLKEDTDSKRQDFDGDQKTAREALDDEYAFQTRQVDSKIATLTQNLAKGAPEPEEVKALRAQKVGLEASYKQAQAGMVKAQAEYTAAEKAAFAQANDAILAERSRVRLVYLQTDTPYLNTAVSLSVRNLGTPVQFVSEAVPLPATASANISYALVNVQNHNLKIAAQLDWPFYESWSLGLGLEYVLFDLAYVRVGYSLNSLTSGLSALSAGFGVHFTAGFTEYAVDYAFKPLADYGFQHSIGISISF